MTKPIPFPENTDKEIFFLLFPVSNMSINRCVLVSVKMNSPKVIKKIEAYFVELSSCTIFLIHSTGKYL